MNIELDRKLQETKQGMMRLQKINSMLEDLNKQKTYLNVKSSELEKILEKEEFDVDKLEGKSMSHIFHTILGNFDEHLEKEQKEAITAKLKYDQAVRDLETINDQISKLNLEMIQYKSCESNYRELYEKKKDILIMSDNIVGGRVLIFSEQISLTTNHIKEIKEVIHAGYNVIEHLDNAIESLESAEDWGSTDILGGGLISNLAKYSHIDTAASEVEKAQNALLSFRTELAAVMISNNIAIEIDEFSKFADYFFGGIIADWKMLLKIEKSKAGVCETKNQVYEVLSKLKDIEEEDILEIAELEQKMSELIVNA